MSAPHFPLSFESGRALILHRPHANLKALSRQLSQMGMQADVMWPDLPEDAAGRGYVVLFFDADMGHDSQFPWPPGQAPMPAIALIGSEAPGRIAWTMRQGADAHLLKPIGSGGVYSALLIANQAFQRRLALGTELAGLSSRLAKREALAEATATIMVVERLSAPRAYDRLRKLAMEARISIEEQAERLVAQSRHRRWRDGQP